MNKLQRFNGVNVLGFDQYGFKQFEATIKSKAAACYEGYDLRRLEIFLNTLRNVKGIKYIDISKCFYKLPNQFVIDLPYTSNYIANNLKESASYIEEYERFVNMANNLAKNLMKKAENDYLKAIRMLNKNKDAIVKLFKENYMEGANLDSENILYWELEHLIHTYILMGIEEAQIQFATDERLKAPYLTYHIDGRSVEVVRDLCNRTDYKRVNK